VTGRVRAADGDPVSSWVNPTSLLTGALFVATSAYLAVVYLSTDSERAGDPGLRRYFTQRALATAVVTGLLAAITLAVLHTTAAAAVLLALDKIRLIRLLAALAVTAVIWGWALAQHPLLLPPHLTIHDAAAPAAAGVAKLIVVAIIVVLVGPSFVLLDTLTQRGTLSEPGER
jgi:cytochrome d ubiquinol oxidase subunit II